MRNIILIGVLIGVSFQAKSLPEIHVIGNGNAILDGQAVPWSNNFTDMGDLWVPNYSQLERTYTILNIGNSSLTIAPIPKPRSEAGADIGFSISQQPANIIPPGGSSNFKVRFAPFSNTIGNYYSYLYITNSDPNENPYNFTLRADVISPEIRVTGRYSNEGLYVNIPNNSMTFSYINGTDFGLTQMGATTERTFRVENIGNAPLFIGSFELSPQLYNDFEIIQFPANWIPPGSNTEMVVRFTPDQWFSDETAEISFDTMDADEDPFTFEIRGQGINPDMGITGNDITVSNVAHYGYIAPSSSNYTDFGIVPMGGFIERVFQIHNPFNPTLGTDLAIAPIANPGNGFSIPVQPRLLVTNGFSTEMVVRYEPGAVGTVTSMVVIVNSDFDDNPYTFFVRGEAVVPSVDPPEINVTGNGQNILNGSDQSAVSLANHTQFLDTLVGDTTFRTYTIENLGEGDSFLSVAVIKDPGNGFAVSQQPIGPIEAGTSTTLTIAFSPAVVGPVYGIISISNNDTDENPYQFVIYGTGINP